MPSLRRLILAAALAALPISAAPSSALAHAAPVGPNGGMQTHAGPYHQEVVVKDGEMRVFLYTMEDAPIPTDGATGFATVLAGGKTERVELKPAGGNALAGAGGFTAKAGTKIVTSVTLAGKGAVQARYEIKAAGHAGH